MRIFKMSNSIVTNLDNVAKKLENVKQGVDWEDSELSGRIRDIINEAVRDMYREFNRRYQVNEKGIFKF